jgi:HAMP domain-containing protein
VQPNHALVLASGDGFEVRALLHKSLNQAQQAFVPLDQNVLLISLVALSASLGGALLLARSVSKPVEQLAAVAERVRQGDYQANLDLHRSDELGRLATTFKAMQQGIAERERQLAHNALHDALTGLPNCAWHWSAWAAPLRRGDPWRCCTWALRTFARLMRAWGRKVATWHCSSFVSAYRRFCDPAIASRGLSAMNFFCCWKAPTPRVPWA